MVSCAELNWVANCDQTGGLFRTNPTGPQPLLVGMGTSTPKSSHKEFFPHYDRLLTYGGSHRCGSGTSCTQDRDAMALETKSQKGAKPLHRAQRGWKWGKSSTRIGVVNHHCRHVRFKKSGAHGFHTCPEMFALTATFNINRALPAVPLISITWASENARNRAMRNQAVPNLPRLSAVSVVVLRRRLRASPLCPQSTRPSSLSTTRCSLADPERT